MRGECRHYVSEMRLKIGWMMLSGLLAKTRHHYDSRPSGPRTLPVSRDNNAAGGEDESCIWLGWRCYRLDSGGTL